jgi:hypothetical protein
LLRLPTIERKKMRKSDSDKLSFFRSSARVLRKSGKWYCETREGDRGPFDSRDEAELELQRYVEIVEFIDNNKSELPKGVDSSEVDIVELKNPPYLS